MSENVAARNTSKTSFLGLFLLFCFYGTSSANDGNVGCLFAESICLDNVEWCFDDFAFGKCLPKNGIEPEDMEQEPLDEQQSHTLSTMLEELQGAGLGWEDLFVQCRMQGALFSLRNNIPMPQNLCANLAPDPSILDPQSPLAFVRFTPPDDSYADEVYYPPIKKGFDDRLYMKPLKTIQPPIKLTSENFNIQPASTNIDLSDVNDINDDRQFYDNPIPSHDLENRIKDIRNRIELRRMLAEYESGHLKPPIYYTNGVVDADEEDYDDPDTNGYNDIQRYEIPNDKRSAHFREETMIPEPIVEDLPKTSFREIAREYNIPAIHVAQPQRQPNFHYVEESNNIPVEPIKSKVHPQHYNGESNDISPEGGVYTEGGLVFVPDSDSQGHFSLNQKFDARNLLANMLGFTRHERLDVKKPGPPAAPPPSHLSPNETPKLNDTSSTPEQQQQSAKDVNKEVLPAHFHDATYPKMKKHTDDEHAPYSVDTEFTYVRLKTPIENWKDGPRIVTALADMLNMQNYFTFSRVDRHEISFRVEDNPEKKTADDVAKAINDSRFKNNLSRRLGVIVINAGVGDKAKEPLSVSVSKVDANSEDMDIRLLLFACGGASVLGSIALVLFMLKIRQHHIVKEKLAGLQGGLGGTETSSNDYQELCRARMAGKGNTNESVSSVGRVASLTKENDKPPSSRSSTSSWSEEPALTNMDISTGHIVLTYMEDHLKNKGRLQREWEALCRYEAEPGSHDAATQPQCGSLNRPTAPFPYDHSRVVVNHLANAEGIDYINASTISDHDPRTPAYIAAQGPVPATLAHFWQMIWEQGAVVIVALCRLQENGEIACARYWPEEGAEVYHIYEVHLVSEHIWCDDYLVRSFYLKNLRTSETRTVTQFHFLSWPQGGIPAAPKALLDFRRKVNKSYRGRSCPIVVHSSNGAGRTGAYILLDLVLARMNKGAKEIDIAATLEHLRDQRSGLVATKPQFEFVLTAVAEEVHAILKALPANPQPDKRELDIEAVKEQDAEKDPNGKSATTKKEKSSNEK